MKRVCGRDVIEALVLAVALSGASSMLAESTTTTCDNKCGDSQKCKYTCCHITTKRVEGVDIVTKISCSSSICCAHPEGSATGNTFGLPVTTVEGVSGPIKWGLAGTADLDASAISVETDNKSKTVTLSGTVKSEDQRRLVGQIAKKQAKGYKVANRLTIANAK